MAFRSSANDLKSSNAIASKFRNELVFWGTYCQTNWKPETPPIHITFSDYLSFFSRGDISKLQVVV